MVALRQAQPIWSQLLAWLRENSATQSNLKLMKQMPSILCEVESLEQSLGLALELNLVGFALEESLKSLNDLKKRFFIQKVQPVKFQTRLYALEKKVSHPALERLLRVTGNGL